MFTIFDGREYFYQWDIDRKLIVSDSSVEEVHFCNRFTNYSLVVEPYELEGITVVDVPNIILQNGFDLHVYAYDEKYTKFDDVFHVEPRTRPADYVYTQEEIKVWDEMEKKVIHLEYLLGEKGIEEAIAEYFVENPIQPGASEAEVAQIEQNKTDIAQLQEAAATHATTEYVDEAIGAIPPVDFTGYATEEFVDKKIAAAQLEDAEADLEAYYTKSEVDAKVKETADAIPSVEGLASETYVDEAIAAIPPVSFEGYATEEYVGEQIAAIPPVSFEGYATEGYVDAAIEAIPEVDLSDYALKSELPSTVGLASEEYVNQQIEAIPDVDLTGYAKETYVDEKVGAIVIPEVPTKLSAFENDVPFLTEHQSLENYYNKEEVDAAIEENAVDTSAFRKVNDLPTNIGFTHQLLAKQTTVEDTAPLSSASIGTFAQASGKAKAIEYLHAGRVVRAWSNNIILEQADIDANGWQLGLDFTWETTLTPPIYISPTTAYFIIGNTMYSMAPSMAAQGFKNMTKYFNRTWFDNTDTGLSSTDVPAAIKELKTLIPDLSNYYSKEEADAAINTAVGAIEPPEVIIDNKAIMKNEDGALTTAVGGSYVDIIGETYAEQTGLTGEKEAGFNYVEVLPYSYTKAITEEDVGQNFWFEYTVNTRPDETFRIEATIKSVTAYFIYTENVVPSEHFNSVTIGVNGEEYYYPRFGIIEGAWTDGTDILTSLKVCTPTERVWEQIDVDSIPVDGTTIVVNEDKKLAVNFDGYATTGYVDEAVGGIDIPETDLSNYYTKEEVDSAIGEAGSDIDTSTLVTKAEYKAGLAVANPYTASTSSIVMIKPDGYTADDTAAIGNARVQPIATYSEEAFWESVKQGYPTFIGGSGVSTTLTQAILDENGWTKGFDFANNATLSIPVGISGGSQKIYLWVINNVVYRGWEYDRESRINAVNYFNKLWFDNTGTGLVSTDIPAAINELAGKVPDMTSYYTKDEVDTAISEAGSGGDVVIPAMPKYFSDGLLSKADTTSDIEDIYFEFANNFRDISVSTVEDFIAQLAAGKIVYVPRNTEFQVTQEMLDAQGWAAPIRFQSTGYGAMSVPFTVSNVDYRYFVIDGCLYCYYDKNSDNAAGNYMVKYFNRIWYDNSTSGLTATDIPAAINELAASIPEAVDLTNYYTKTEVDTAISNALAAIGIAEEGTY